MRNQEEICDIELYLCTRIIYICSRFGYTEGSRDLSKIHKQLHSWPKFWSLKACELITSKNSILISLSLWATSTSSGCNHFFIQGRCTKCLYRRSKDKFERVRYGYAKFEVLRGPIATSVRHDFITLSIRCSHTSPIHHSDGKHPRPNICLSTRSLPQYVHQHELRSWRKADPG